MELSSHYAPKVLIVDDDEEQLKILTTQLESLECQIFLAQSGSEALEIVKNHEFALFMLDIHMPEMDGYALAKSFKDVSSASHVPIIFMTAVDSKDFQFFKGYDLGAFDFLMKPFQKQIIQSKVKVFLELYQHQRSALRMVMLEKQKLELSKQKQDLEKSNRDLESFANVAAHDIKSPIHLVSSLVSIIKDDEESQFSESTEMAIDKMRESCERMVTLVDSILEFASVGEKQLTRESFELEEVLSEVLEDLSLDIEKTNTNVIIKELPPIEGCKELIGQSFQNLISNAIKYREDSRDLRIVVECVASNRRGDVSIKISDNGTGMDQDKLGLIFQPFKRLVSDSKAEGCGIGLATVKKIMDAHFGSISVTSQMGEGTTFVLCFPKSSPQENLRLEPRIPKTEDKALKFYRLAAELDPYEAVVIDESVNGYGCKIKGTGDVKIGDLLYLTDGRHFEVCWIHHEDNSDTTFGLKLMPPV